MPAEYTRQLVIQTPEGLSFSLPLAGPLARFLAWAADTAAALVITSVVLTLLQFLELLSRDFAAAIATLAGFTILMGYNIVQEWLWRGQTLGKRLLRLRVMDVQGLHLQFSQIVVRNLLRVVDALPALYLAGGLTTLCNRRNQRLGDLAANTVVVRVPARQQPDISQLMPDKFNSFRGFPHLEARLRQRISPTELRVLSEALLRRDQLDSAARARLFDELAAHLRQIVAFPEAATVGLTDEQYVRNALESIYRKQGGQRG
jgi:uncharacterized RDD family membrane protein YckC